MRFWHRHQTTKLSAPVAGNYVNFANTRDTNSHVQFAIQPSDTIINSPLNGDVLAMSLHSITLQAFNGQIYRLELADANSSYEYFNWQVRVGDTVSPLSILGMLSIDPEPTTLLICEQLVAKHQDSVVVPAY